jgi:hypothetical protein
VVARGNGLTALHEIAPHDLSSFTPGSLHPKQGKMKLDDYFTDKGKMKKKTSEMRSE